MKRRNPRERVIARREALDRLNQVLSAAETNSMMSIVVKTQRRENVVVGKLLRVGVVRISRVPREAEERDKKFLREENLIGITMSAIVAIDGIRGQRAKIKRKKNQNN